jgi:hypothetical protein
MRVSASFVFESFDLSLRVSRRKTGMADFAVVISNRAAINPKTK